MAGNRHIAWIDDARTITMLLVIVGHCTYTKIVTNYGGIDYFADITYDEYSIAAKLLNALVGLIYMFYMPLFMMLSGACFGLTIGKVSDRSSLVKNKSKRLLVPFLFTTFLLVLPLKYIGGYYSDSTNVLSDMFMGQVLLLGNSHLWFIASLFWIFLFYFVLYKIGLARQKYFLLLLVVPTLVGTYLVNKGIEFLGLVGAIKHLLYFAIGFKCLEKINVTCWGGRKILIHSVLYIFFFYLFGKYGYDKSLVMKLIHCLLLIVMGLYGSMIMIQISKKVGLLKVIVNNGIYKTFSHYSYELYLFSDPFNYVLLYLMYVWMGAYVADNMGSILSFLIRFCGTICFAFIVIVIKASVYKICKGVYVKICKS